MAIKTSVFTSEQDYSMMSALDKWFGDVEPFNDECTLPDLDDPIFSLLY